MLANASTEHGGRHHSRVIETTITVHKAVKGVLSKINNPLQLQLMSHYADPSIIMYMSSDEQRATNKNEPVCFLPRNLAEGIPSLNNNPAIEWPDQNPKLECTPQNECTPTFTTAENAGKFCDELGDTNKTPRRWHTSQPDLELQLESEQEGLKLVAVTGLLHSWASSSLSLCLSAHLLAPWKFIISQSRTWMFSLFVMAAVTYGVGFFLTYFE